MYTLPKTTNPAYGVADVKQQFKLQHLEDFTVFPFVGVIARWFAHDLKKTPQKYGITDFIIGKEDYEDRALDKSIAVVDGKIVTVALYAVDIFIEGIEQSPLDKLIKHAWNVGSIKFNGNKKSANKLLRTLKQYTERYSLNLLVRATVPKLHWTAISFLGGEIKEFYAPHKSGFDFDSDGVSYIVSQPR